MKLARNVRLRGEGGFVLWFIVLALVGGALWFLYSSRRDGERNARIFASEVVQRVAVNYDEKYLHVHLSPEAQVKYLASWRERMLLNLRQLGTVKQPIEVKGDVQFTSGFFDPHGNFRAELTYPTTTAAIELVVTRGMTVWQVDDINLIWTPAPTPTPSPSPTPEMASPTPSPSPAQTKRKRKDG